jgi:hypothetical protein
MPRQFLHQADPEDRPLRGVMEDVHPGEGKKNVSHGSHFRRRGRIRSDPYQSLRPAGWQDATERNGMAARGRLSAVNRTSVGLRGFREKEEEG